jgi:hypothetical protein
VLRIGGAPAVAEKQYLPTLVECLETPRQQFGKGLGKCDPRPLRDGGVLGELGLKVTLQIHAKFTGPCFAQRSGGWASNKLTIGSMPHNRAFGPRLDPAPLPSSHGKTSKRQLL